VTLRIKLIVRPPELSHLPWELLYDPDQEVFLAARLSYPIVRFIESGTPVASLLARRPLRVLYVQANPPDTVELNTRASERALRDALGADAEITSVHSTTPSALRDALRERPGFHVLHYDGHAEFDVESEAGYLYLHDEGGRSYRLGGEMLATYLDGTSVRLVVLSACETGVDSRQKRFSGLAHQLMRASSLPAVVAMQFEVADDTAIALPGDSTGRWPTTIRWTPPPSRGARPSWRSWEGMPVRSPRPTGPHRSCSCGPGMVTSCEKRSRALGQWVRRERRASALTPAVEPMLAAGWTPRAATSSAAIRSKS